MVPKMSRSSITTASGRKSGRVRTHPGEVLRHEDYRIVGDQREPGREHPTTRVTVSLTKGGRTIPEVPFYVVQTERGGWLVEQVELERITR